MGFPSITAEAVTTPASSDPAVIDVPAHDAGDRLVIVMTTDTAVAHFGIDALDGEAWVNRFSDDAQQGLTKLDVYEIVSAGADHATPTTVDVDLGQAKPHLARCWRVIGSHATQALEAAGDIPGPTTTRDPPALAPSWGADDTLWIAYGNHDGDSSASAFNGDPAGYTILGTDEYVDAAEGIEHRLGWRTVNAATEDPGAYSLTVGIRGMAATIAIRGAAVTTHEATPDDVGHAHEAAQPTVTQTHEVAPIDVDHAHEAGASTVVQVHGVAPVDVDHAHEAATGAVTQTHEATPGAVEHAHTSDEPAVGQTHEVAPAGGEHAHTSTEPVVSSDGSVAPDPSTHTHAAGQPTITQTHEVAPATVEHAHTSTEPQLGQTHEVAPATVEHAHEASEPALGDIVAVQPDGSSHEHDAGQPALGTVYVLAVDGTSHTHTSGVVVITQTHEVAPAGSVHGHEAASPVVIAGVLPLPPGRTVRVPARGAIRPSARRAVMVQ